MQKNAYKIIALTLLLMLLCGCKQSRSLGERAIVKMVYLDESGGQVQAGLVVFTCAPNSDTASVEGQAKIYTAQGKSIEEALYKAEQQQNKKQKETETIDFLQQLRLGIRKESTSIWQ